MSETTKPHHFSKEGRELKAQEDALKESGQAPKVEKQDSTESKEASIPLSQIEAMVAKMLSEREKVTTPQASVQYYQPKSENVIDDIPELQNWEMKDRQYELCDGSKPISCSIPNKHTDLIALQYVNKDSKKVSIMRYATNQTSFFVENQSKELGSVLVSEIIFSFGRLNTTASDINLQQFLEIHPYKDRLFRLYDPTAASRKIVTDKKLKHKAESMMYENSEVLNRAIASVLCEDYVPTWEEDILFERLLSEIDKDVVKFTKLSDDPQLKMKGVIKSALAKGDLIYSNYRFTNKNKEVILEVSKNQNELDEAVKYFESGEGRSFYEFLQN
jgi:hypothetical protein